MGRLTPMIANPGYSFTWGVHDPTILTCGPIADIAHRTCCGCRSPAFFTSRHPSWHTCVGTLAEEVGVMTSPQQTDRDHVEGVPLPAITDETMRSRLAMAQRYTAVLLRRTEKLVRPGVDPAIWEHGRRNIALVENGVMAIVLPVADDSSDWAGLAVFTADEATVRAILDHDPGVQAGIFDYEIHPVRGFPGAHLPSPEPEGTAPEARW